jgi:hypothetical protein
MAVPPVPGVVQGPRELYRAPDPTGIFELVDRLGEGSYGAVYKVGRRWVPLTVGPRVLSYTRARGDRGDTFGRARWSPSR